MNVVSVLNTAWMVSCRGEAAAFGRSTEHVGETQAQVLTSIIRRNVATEFGLAHAFASIENPATYQQRVPLSQYEDYAPAISRIAEGRANVLTREAVQLLEPTSGTTAAEKLIPFTSSLRAQFQRAVAAWMHDLLRHRPRLRRGRAYWSISPALGAGRRTASGIPIGFEDDAAYLGVLGGWLVRRLLAVPSDVAQLGDIEAFRYATLLHLLRCQDLSLISIWSPAFLTSLLRPLENWQERLCHDIESRSPERASALRRIFRSHLSWPEKLRLVWPQLSLISCWADAGAAAYVPQVRDLFPAVEIQPKGLLATEGCVSFPLLGRVAPILAVRSHFFEFQEIEPRGEVRLAHELDAGGRYRVILTTAGGLYRYQLRDEVEVCGFENRCPLIRFVGKSDCVSDLTGEKLSEPHVRAVLQRVLEKHRIAPAFALLVPVEGTPPLYRLYLQGPAAEPVLVRIKAEVEEGLCGNPHYAYARGLGQLQPLDVARLDDDMNGWAIYERQCLARGMKAGSIKPLALDRWSGWPALFDPLRRQAASERPAQAAAQIP